MKTPLEIVILLEKCAVIETVMMEIYDLFAENSAYDYRVAKFWRKLAREEENHARQFALAARIQDVSGIAVDPWKVKNTLQVVESVLKSARTSPPCLVDAVRSALKMEEKLEVFHVDCVATFEDNGTKRLFQAMLANDRDHVGGLRKFYEKLIQGLPVP